MAIIIENLTYVYMKGTPYEKTALNNINLKIEDGEFVGIIGHTGSGKSTLIQHFNGLLKPTTGKVTVNGFDVAEKGIRELRKQVGLVFQYPEHQLFEETVFKDIAYGLGKLKLEASEIKNRVYKATTAVGLDLEVLDKSPFELSGGQKRRVAIAGIIAMEPKILVLDEPTAGLDPHGRDEIFKLISTLHKKEKITVIMVSHSMEDIANLASRVVVMANSIIEMDGDIKSVFKNTASLESIGLRAPQITYLMKKLESIIPEINPDIFTIDEAKKEILKHLGGNIHA